MMRAGAIHFTRRQMLRIIYGALRDQHTSRTKALYIALRECKPVTVGVHAMTDQHTDVCNDRRA